MPRLHALPIAMALLMAVGRPAAEAAGGSQPAATPARVVKITGDAHKLLLRADGSVAGWGLYNHGQLGPVAAITGVRDRSSALVEIALPGKAVDIAAGVCAARRRQRDGVAARRVRRAR